MTIQNEFKTTFNIKHVILHEIPLKRPGPEFRFKNSIRLRICTNPKYSAESANNVHTLNWQVINKTLCNASISLKNGVIQNCHHFHTRVHRLPWGGGGGQWPLYAF